MAKSPSLQARRTTNAELSRAEAAKDRAQPAQAPEARLDSTEAFIAQMNSVVAAARTELTTFSESLAKDPVHAMTWSEKAFKAAALIKVRSTAASYLTHGCAFSDLKREATKEVIRAARYPARSSSVQSNLMEQEVAAAWAKLLELIEYFVEV